jgi:predicted Zn-ribbon and HTH transcriptional regulator
MECKQCGFEFKITEDNIHPGESFGIIISCPRCKGRMLYEYIKTVWDKITS